MAWSAYRNFHGEVKREIKLAERELISNQIKKDPGNSNNIWKTIRLCKDFTIRSFGFQKITI